MRIVLVSPHFPPRHIGGVEIYVKRLADELQRRGDRPEVVCVERVDRTADDVVVVRDVDFGYPVHRLQVNGHRLGTPLSASYDSTELRAALDRILDTSTPDLLHLHSGYLLGAASLGAARSRRVPTLVTLHDFWFICSRITMVHPSTEPCTGPESPAKCAWCLATERRRYRNTDRLTGLRLGRAIDAVGRQPALQSSLNVLPAVRSVSERQRVLADALTHAQVILSPSRFLREQVARTGIPAERILVSRYGIDVRPARKRPPRQGGSLRIGYLGQLAPHKGVHVLVDAVARLPGAALTLRLYGDPAPHPAYVQRLRDAARGDGRVEFPGPYRHEAVYDVLADLDIIVVPSIWYENSPFVIQEAQSVHVPVVASRLGGMRELVTDERDGLLFETGNPVDLSRQLRRLLEEPGLLDRLRPDGQSVRRADDEMRELLAHYQRLLD
jgi:glycosyltransferase involved in cell wall biosynthesis